MNQTTQGHDIAVIGGGIVGLAAADAILKKKPGTRILLLEKEGAVARHQTGRNSGVIHSGMYYKPGSFKALLCREGYASLIDFAREEKIPFDICGKVVVALDEAELPRLQTLQDRAAANGLVGVERLDPAGLRSIEPHAIGLAALRVPETGIIDYVDVCLKLAARLRARGTKILYGEPVIRIQTVGDSKVVSTRRGHYPVGAILNCGGLHCDVIARLDGLDPGLRIAPFRGEYYTFADGAPALCKHLIYPVPDPSFPFLGVHFTRMVRGGIECGPNAVLAFGREAYTWGSFNIGETLSTLAFSGFRKLAVKHWRMGLGEFHRSLSKAAFVKALQRLIPEVRAEHLVTRAAGIRAQALKKDGTLVDDFHFVAGKRSLHVLNAPSPAATAAFAIGREIAERFEKAMG